MNTKILALALVAAAPFAASADEASYRYLDVSYQFGGSIDAGPSIDTDGFALEASFPIGDNWHVAFDYSDLGTDPSAIDISDWALKAGWHNDVFFANVGLESAEFDFCAVLLPPCTIDDSGYNVDFGVRAMTSDTFELNGHVGYSDLGDLDTYTNYGVGAVFLFSESLGLSFNYEMRAGDGIDLSSYGLGLRWNF